MILLRKVCILVNDNLYNSKRYFSYRLKEALERQGVHCELIDVKSGTLDAEHILFIQNFHPDITLSFSTVACLPDRTFISDHMQIPHLFILVDPAVYYMKFTQSKYAMISCVDHFDLRFLQTANFKTSFFLPHAVEREMLDIPIDQERQFDVVMIGSCYDHEGLQENWRTNLPASLCNVIEHTIDLTLKDPKKHFTEALVDAWGASGLDFEGINFLQLCNYIDNYLRGKDRVELVRSIRNVNVHIFGGLYWDEEGKMKSWEHYVGNQKNVTIHKPVGFEEVFSILKQSKICLSSTPFFKYGSHERVFNSLATGCAVITSENGYLREHFSPHDGVGFYNFQYREEVNSIMDHWLACEEDRFKAVQRGRDLVMRGHTWDNRAQSICEEVPKLLGYLFA